MPDTIKGEGAFETVTRIRVRKHCELCDRFAEYKHTYLLEGTRTNPASSAYGKDDCRWCEDLASFTCGQCRPSVPDGYTSGARFGYSDRVAHLFLE